MLAIWITGSISGSGNMPFRPAHSISKLRIRYGAICKEKRYNSERRGSIWTGWRIPFMQIIRKCVCVDPPSAHSSSSHLEPFPISRQHYKPIVVHIHLNLYIYMLRRQKYRHSSIYIYIYISVCMCVFVCISFKYTAGRWCRRTKIQMVTTLKIWINRICTSSLSLIYTYI